MRKFIDTIIGVALFIIFGYTIANYGNILNLPPEANLLILLLVPTFIAGLLSGEPVNGALCGFLTVFIPSLLLGIFLIFLSSLMIIPVPINLMELITSMLGILSLILGVVIIILGFVGGLLGAFIGAIGGWVTTKIKSRD